MANRRKSGVKTRFVRRATRAVATAMAIAGAASFAAGCGGSGGGDDAPVVFAEPVADPDAAAAAFRLFYAERVERAATALNRFTLFGDTHFATTIGRAAVAREGARFEVVAGPKDNNLIGTSAWATYQAYRVFRTRPLALTLIRMFNGIAFLEAVSGHPGLTVREALPGWTRVVDGRIGTVLRIRDGAPVSHPDPPPGDLEREIVEAFFSGVQFTYRENPAETFFSFMPAASLEAYALTLSFAELPRFLRVSDCCSSFMRTPEGYPWAGAFWGNHNSRDNFPDLALGVLAAREARDDPLADADLREAADRAVAAGARVGDLIQSSGGNLLTVDEHNPYGTLVVSGAVRPHGEPENQDLGSMAACQMAYLARAISSEGLDLPVPELPAPGSIEALVLRDLLGLDVDLPLRICTGLEDAYFGLTWGELPRVPVFGVPLVDLVRALEEVVPGIAQTVFGSFQNDYDDIVESTLAVLEYARIAGKPELEAAARRALGDQTDLMRTFADLIFGRDDPFRQQLQRYDAAVFDALGGREPIVEDLSDFFVDAFRMDRAEALVDLEDTAPAPLLTDAEIAARVEAAVSSVGRASIRDRYRAAYGTTPPVRRAGEGYEARTAAGRWRRVERPRHTAVGTQEILGPIALCERAPHLLDCTWAVLGCRRADLDASGAVDGADRALFEAARTRYPTETPGACRPRNRWCEGADLDRTGTLDGTDAAFLTAAEGCTGSPGAPGRGG